MNTIVKICGLKTPDAVDAAIEAGADMVGFISSIRARAIFLSIRRRRLGARVGPKAAKVLFTVDADDASLAAAIAALDPAFLQLHGAETPERVAAIRAGFDIKVIKAIGIGERADLDQSRATTTSPTCCCSTRGLEPDASRPGGTGVRFDWSLLARRPPKKPWLLAGGLNAANVAQALRQTGAPGVDMSSGVESAPGVKDKLKSRNSSPSSGRRAPAGWRGIGASDLV